MEPLARFTVHPLARWLSQLPWSEWPQQHRLSDGQLRPAMVSDPGWHGFGAQIADLEAELMRHFPGLDCAWRALSVVMPGHAIPSHTDAQREEWLTRVHIPVLTNPDALFISGELVYRLLPGFAYKVDTRISHSIVNAGALPRVHLMFDIRRG